MTILFEFENRWGNSGFMSSNELDEIPDNMDTYELALQLLPSVKDLICEYNFVEAYARDCLYEIDVPLMKTRSEFKDFLNETQQEILIPLKGCNVEFLYEILMGVYRWTYKIPEWNPDYVRIGCLKDPMVESLKREFESISPGLKIIVKEDIP